MRLGKIQKSIMNLLWDIHPRGLSARELQDEAGLEWTIVEKTLDNLRDKGLIYASEGCVWNSVYSLPIIETNDGKKKVLIVHGECIIE